MYKITRTYIAELFLRRSLEIIQDVLLNIGCSRIPAPQRKFLSDNLDRDSQFSSQDAIGSGDNRIAFDMITLCRDNVVSYNLSKHRIDVEEP